MDYQTIKTKVANIQELEEAVHELKNQNHIYYGHKRYNDDFLPIPSKEIISKYIQNLKDQIVVLKEELEGTTPNLITHLENINKQDKTITDESTKE